MSEENRLAIVKPSPFSESMKGTLGAGVGLALLVGIPTVIVGGVALYLGIKLWRAVANWKSSTSDKIENHENLVGAKVENSTIGEVEVKFIEEKPRQKRTRSRNTSRSIVR